MASLTLTVNELRNQAGKVCIALFDTEAGFPKDDTQAVFNRCFEITELPLTLSCEVPYGSYAVSILHDENEDGQLNTGVLGIPQEGIGFSNDPRIIKGTPSFETTRFEFTESTPQVQVTIKYF